MFADQASQVRAVDTSRHVMSGGDAKQRARIIIEARCVVEPGRFSGLLAKSKNAFRAVIEPPRWPQKEAGIMTGKRRKFASVGGLVQRENNDREVSVVAEFVQERP